jgi:hypothetical protein
MSEARAVRAHHQYSGNTLAAGPLHRNGGPGPDHLRHSFEVVLLPEDHRADVARLRPQPLQVIRVGRRPDDRCACLLRPQKQRTAANDVS